ASASDRVRSAPAFRAVPATGVYANVPGVLAVAFSWVALSAVPNVMSVGVAHVMTGVAFSTLTVTVLVAVVKLAASVGVKVTDRIRFAPAVRTSPAAGA